MHRHILSKTGSRAGLGLVLVAAIIYVAGIASVQPADSKVEKAPKTEQKPSKSSAKKKLSGADLYAMHCNRCHAERYATEWNPTQWKTLMLHMRVRANLPAAQAKAVLKYLQEDAGN